jgi:tRNA U34 5-methylaminomethyl-2-thiouridine-forming methyltransferase MnmC
MMFNGRSYKAFPKFGLMNKIITTADGSNTLFNETIGEHYHSTHGALQESEHVFIDAGLKHAIEQFPGQEISIFEVGFGTGLNFLLTLAHCKANDIKLNYVGVEAFPITKHELSQTGYDKYVPAEIWSALVDNYESGLTGPVDLFDNQKLSILESKLQELEPTASCQLLYYDAFSVRHQEEMWTDEVIAHAASFLVPGGIFVTYAITGKLKRALKSLGFTIQKLPGAAGKREMLRAIKAS